MAIPADTIFTNGPIITVDEEHPGPEAVAVHGDRIVAVGDRVTVQAFSGPETQTIDLTGRALLPGLNDNHTHPMAYGQAVGWIDATPDTVDTLRGLQAAFHAAANDTNEKAGWLLARGYDDTRLDVHRHPTRYELDEVTGGQPAYLVRTCGHLAVANSAALALAGVTRETANPAGGQIDRDEHGDPTGLLRETAMGLVKDVIPQPTIQDIQDYLRAAGERFLRFGITSVGEAAIRTSDEFAAYERLANSGELPFRVFTMMLIDETLESLAKLGMRTGFGNDWLRVGPAKLFQDGSGGGRTAAMFTDYRNDPGNRGITIYTQDELDERFTRAHAAGFQLAAHAIGDRAITMILNAYEKAFATDPRPNHRARIEHCGLCTLEIMDRLVAMEIIPIPQPAFVHYLGDSYLENFSPEQIDLSYPSRAWLDRGLPAVGSSDVPVVPCEPWINIQSAVTRLTRTGQEMGANQRITIDEAIRMFTLNGAYASFEEDIKGSITVGKLADLIVVDRDPRTVAPTEIHTIQNRLTMIGGKVVYQA